jgi:thiamine biosynthesis lipoprotein
MTTLESHRFTAFGGAACEVHACYCGPDEISATVAEVYAFEAQLTRFSPASELSRFNRAAGSRVDVSALLEVLLRATLDAYWLSDGLVNAAVPPALVAAGYDRTIEAVRRRQHVLPAAPTSNDIAVPPLPEVLCIGRGWARLAPGCAVDLGGVGKGWLADRLAERLGDAAVNLGGDVRALGQGPDGDGWCVGLCDGAAVMVRDAGIATSGVSGRNWPGGHHLVDPRSGRPAQTDVSAMTVVAADALRAETLAKAGVLTGGEAASRFVLDRGASRAVVVRTAVLEAAS